MMAAQEAEASRELIAKADAQIVSLERVVTLHEKESALQKSIIELQEKQKREQGVIITNLTEENTLLLNRIEKLERSNARWKTVAKIAGTVALAFVVPKLF